MSFEESAFKKAAQSGSSPVLAFLVGEELLEESFCFPSSSIIFLSSSLTSKGAGTGAGAGAKGGGTSAFGESSSVAMASFIGRVALLC